MPGMRQGSSQEPSFALAFWRQSVHSNVLHMKSIYLYLLVVTLLTQVLHAGGNSTVVRLSHVDKITIEDDKIIIVGDGMASKRIMTSEEHKDSSVFGRPTQMNHAKITNGVFELIPYFSRQDIEGVPTGGHTSDELKILSDTWWAETLKTAKKVSVGDSVTIGYQGDIVTISDFTLKRIVGWGSVRINSR